MFKLPNAVLVTPVRTDSDKNTTPALFQLPTPEDTAEYATQAAYWGKQATKGLALLYVGKKVVDTASEIAVIAAQAHFNK